VIQPAIPPFKLLESWAREDAALAAQTQLQNRNPQIFQRWEASRAL